MIYSIKPDFSPTVKKVEAKNKVIPLNNCVWESKDVLVDKYIDIKARGKYPFNVLSNLAPTNFKLDGVQINSMEGFLQSLKISDPEKQRKMCLLDGFEAKKMSKSIKRSENDMVLYWKGKSFLKNSEDYFNIKKLIVDSSRNKDEGVFDFDGKKVTSIAAFLTALKVESSKFKMES